MGFTSTEGLFVNVSGGEQVERFLVLSFGRQISDKEYPF